MKKFILGLTVAFTGLTTCVSADNCCDYQEVDACCYTNNCGKGTLFGDFIYWKAKQNGLDYCFSQGFTTAEVGDTTIYNFNSTIKDPSSKWSPGYRVGALWEFSNSNFELGAVWTHYKTSASTSLGVQNLHWNLKYDVIDVLLGYNFLDNCNVSLKLFGGVRLAEIDQKTRSFRVNDFLEFTKIDRNTQDFRGIGPVVALALDWDWTCGLGFYAEGAVSALYGKFNNHINNSVLRVNDIRNQFIHQHNSRCIGAVDAGAGIKFKYLFCNDKAIFVKLGAELHRYFDYNDLGNNGDLCLDGGRVSLGFEF